MNDELAADLRLKVMDHQQATIQRLAGNAFLIKGWAITLASALLGIALKDDSRSMAAVAFLAVLPTLCFWLLDAYYLAAERAMRGLYGTLAVQTSGLPDVSVKLSVGLSHVLGAAFRWVTLLPYLVLLASEVLVGLGVFGKAIALVQT